MAWFIKYLIVTSLVIWFLILVSCKHRETTSFYEEPFIHSCPENGHGDCPICCDPYINENDNEKTLVLGQ